MTQHELDTIIQSGEGYKTEFKRNVNTDLSKELVAFANSSGGRVFLGIEDSGSIAGVTIDNTLRSKVQMMAHDCDPSIQIELEAFNDILIIHVIEGKNKPYRCTGGFYIRNGSCTIKLTTQEIIEFIKTEGKVKFDELRNTDVKYPEQINRFAIDRFMQLAGINTSLGAGELLTNLGVVYNDEKATVFNNTGVLFFVPNPAQFIPQSAVTCVSYKGNSKVDIIDKKTFALDIISNIDDAIDFLKRHLNVAYEIKEKRREEKMEIPEIVLREAIVNAVAHRDYFEKGANVMIELFDNRLEISNPGGLPKGLKPEDFGTRTLARNPLIAALLSRTKYIEKLGTGVPRIRKCMSDAGLPEPIFHFDGFFTVVLKRMYSAEKAISLSLNVSTNRLERMMYLLKQLQPGNILQIKEAAAKFNVIEKSIRQDLLLLEEKGWINSSGTTNNRIYQLSKLATEHLGDLENGEGK